MKRKQPNIHNMTLTTSDGTVHKLAGRRKDLIEALLRILYPTGARDDIRLNPIIVQPNKTRSYQPLPGTPPPKPPAPKSTHTKPSTQSKQEA